MSSVNPLQQVAGPQNTALRAEQRRQGASVSVVRPVVHSPAPVTAQSAMIGELDTALVGLGDRGSSLLDELMTLEQSLGTHASGALSNSKSAHQFAPPSDAFYTSTNPLHPDHPSEAQRRQQSNLMRREEFELQRSVHRQHRFFVAKIEERQHHLQVIAAVWAQSGLKRAIERLVDIYEQGLVFNTSTRLANGGAPPLNSLNKALIVDVLNVLVLRPRLWTLGICQLLLPPITNDLLVQQSPRLEGYVETGIRALRLVLGQFGPIIRQTVEAQREAAKLLVGVDLSREERLNKSLACHKLLIDARSIVARRLNSPPEKQSHKLTGQLRDLQQVFNAYLSLGGV